MEATTFFAMGAFETFLPVDYHQATIRLNIGQLEKKTYNFSGFNYECFILFPSCFFAG